MICPHDIGFYQAVPVGKLKIVQTKIVFFVATLFTCMLFRVTMTQ
ncbi:MAG: hypothetical protein JWR61_4897 [Ferruginibacter sp.]|nr:hypothetical protein [Ferruginibacter sp.]